MFLVVLVDVIKLILVFFYILLYGLFLLLFVFFRGRLVAWKILEVQGRDGPGSLANLRWVWLLDNQGIAVVRVEAILFRLFFFLDGQFSVVFLGYLAHDLVKPVSSDCLNAF
jgi:hypothetical protein